MRVVAIMMDDVIPLYFSSPVDAGGLAFGTQVQHEKKSYRVSVR